MPCQHGLLCVCLGALLLLGVTPAYALYLHGGAFAPNFAPSGAGVTGPQTLLLQIFVNGLPQGVFPVTQTAAGFTLQAATLHRLRLPWSNLTVPNPDKGITSHYDAQAGTLYLHVPVADLLPQALNAYQQDAPPPLSLSPEAMGEWVAYSFNLRHVFGASATGPLFSIRNHSDAWGGLAQFVSTGPDFLGQAGFAYDSTVDTAPIRLDDSFTWRPKMWAFAATVGDNVSSVSQVGAAARSWRFGGIAMGTDHSAAPGWSQTALPSVSGTAQAESAVDVYVNGVRAYQTNITGGRFNLILPPGASGQESRVVVTDAAGRTQIINLQAPLVYADTIRPGLFLWSAGGGAPRFGYATQQSAYAHQIYGYATGRYGLSDKATSEAHIEAGPGLMEGEVGLNGIAGARLAYQALLGVSQADGRRGAAVSGGFSLALPGQLTLDETAGYNLPGFRDVVAVSGQGYGLHGLEKRFAQALPYRSQFSTRISWQIHRHVNFSLSWQQFLYPQTGSVGFESASLGWSNPVAPAFLTVSEDNTDGTKDFSILMGVSIAFGAGSGDASGGFGSHEVMADVSAASIVPQNSTGLGWQVNASQVQQTRFVDALLEDHTRDFIPGLEFQTTNGTSTGIVSLRGVAGLVGLHPFMSASNQAGMLIADVGVPGVPITANGRKVGQTNSSGILAIPAAGDGVAETVSIDTSRMPFNDVAKTTRLTATLRQDGASILPFDVKQVAAGAIVLVTLNGKPPPPGSMLIGRQAQAPIDSQGRAYLPAMLYHEVLTVLLPDGKTCHVRTRFDGQGGVGVVLGPLPCVAGAR